MSLISEALRKARSEAARRGEARQWLPPLSGRHAAPRRSHLGLGLVLGAVIALAAAATGAWLVRRVLVAGDPTGTATAVPVAPGTQQAAARALPAAETAPPEAATPALTRQGGSRLEPPPLAEPAAQPVPVPAPAAAAVRPLGATSAPAQVPEPPPVTPAAPPSGERVFVLHADVGYATLDLDFIVHKPSAPFGRINGRDIVPGSIVEGFRVEEIAADYVRLSDSRGPLVLRVR